MAFIKKYNPSTDKWEIISSTNAAGIYTKDESLLEIGNNVDTVLHNLKEDVDYLKNILGKMTLLEMLLLVAFI